MAKVLLVIGDAAEVLDTFYPLFRIREEGHEVVVAGPARRVYHLVMHEKPDGWDITRESPGYHLAADVAFKEVRPDDYMGLVISGGRAPEYLRYDPDLMRVVRSFFFRDLPVASVCHGIEVVAAAGVLRGRTVTTVAKCQFDAEGGGATYVDRDVVVSGNLVTARTWHDNAPFMREFLKLLNRVAPPPGLARRPTVEGK
jgi:protease I